tara:strand:+ start:174 stop:347 length:174 start_codon:yes stop_codon:yes gene_type:complete
MRGANISRKMPEVKGLVGEADGKQHRRPTGHTRGLENEQATVIAVADRRNGQIEPAQ